MKNHKTKLKNVSNSEQKTFDYGKHLAQYLQPGDVVALNGELGAGKTVFAKGIAEGLGVKETLTSPTFVIIREYEGRLPLYHFDLYRLQADEIDELGYKEYFYADAVTIVEWADKIKEKLPQDYLEVTLLHGSRELDRILDYKGFGTWEERLQQISKSY